MDTQWLSDMFQLTLPVLEKILRPVLVYVFLVIGLRLAGKRELAQLNPFDLVVLLTLSNTVQNAIIGEDNSVTGGLIGASTLLIVNLLVVRFLYRHKKLDEIVEGKEVFLIKQGKILESTLDREVITIDELKAAARKQGFRSLGEVEWATLGPGGTISFIARENRPEIVLHRELMAQVQSLSEEINLLRRQLTGKQDATK